MKLEKVWLPALIVILIAASLFVMLARKGGHDMFPVRYGLDIRGGLRAVLRVDTKDLPQGVVYDQSTQGLVQQTLENRINASGVAEATVQPRLPADFIIEIPDVTDPNAVLSELGTTAQMVFYYFKDVSCDRDRDRPVEMSIGHDKNGEELYSFTDKRLPEGSNTFRDGSQIRADFNKTILQGTNQRPGAVPYTVTGSLAGSLDNANIYVTPDQQKKIDKLTLEMQEWQTFLSNSPQILSGKDILPKSQAQMGGTVGVEPVVTQEFDTDGANAMENFTSNHHNEIMGIVLDDRVLSAPNIEGVISDQGEIHGGFASMKEAQDLASLLNAGALPVPLVPVQTETVAASLGAGAVKESFIAGVVGLSLVLVLMLLWYRLPGLLADVALLIYALFAMAIYRGGLQYFGIPAVTLTLPGIAGFILSIGMAVDANILIFERLKEELRSGKGLKSAIDAGFRRAFPAIRDSNICTCITCLVLYSMGIASVKGFALTLLIGVLVSLFSAITVTRTLLYGLVNLGIANNPQSIPSLFGVKLQTPAESDGAPRKEWNIIGRRNFFYALSVVIIVPGCIFWAMGGLKRGIEFTGGSQAEVKFNQKVTQDQVLNALKGHVPDPSVQMASGDTVAIISTPRVSNDKVVGTDTNVVEKAIDDAASSIGPITPQSFDRVAGQVSKELTWDAFQAVIVASLLIVAYLGSVFAIGGFVAGLRLGTSAIAALIHDVLVLIGTFAILCYYLNWKIDSLFVTAVLTVIGFSVHNTVVIFDRIRENLRHRVRGESFEQLVNHSIVQTMDRSIRTSGTVLITLGTMLIWGGRTTFALNLALFIGVLSGTYSAIFNASAILVDWENWLAKRRAAAGTATAALAPAGPRIGAAANGGSARPIPSRPAPTSSGINAEPGADLGISRIKSKKKKAARRF